MPLALTGGRMEAFGAAAEALRVPVMLHGVAYSHWPSVGPPYLGFSLGRALDTTVLAARLILEGFLDRYPRLKVVLCHGGGFLPYQIGRMQEGYRRGTGRVRALSLRGPEDYLPLLYYDTVTLNAGSLAFLVNAVGSDHVLLGSDYVSGPPAGRLSETLEAANLPPDAAANVCRGTALAVFGMNP